jgi:hypothetical protein
MSKFKHIQPLGQDRNVFNLFKRVVRDISKLTDEQIAALHYESWHEAYVRSSGKVTEEQ